MKHFFIAGIIIFVILFILKNIKDKAPKNEKDLRILALSKTPEFKALIKTKQFQDVLKTQEFLNLSLVFGRDFVLEALGL